MHDILVTVPFAMGSQPDPHKASLILADIGASGLSLPDRDYYLKPEARFKEAREKICREIFFAGSQSLHARGGAQSSGRHAR
jgi:endothelin-converting enzyme/putative endopeptidase